MESARDVDTSDAAMKGCPLSEATAASMTAAAAASPVPDTTLAPVASELSSVPGLHVWPDFCTPEEEAELVAFLDTCEPPWVQEQFGVPTLYRAKHFGALATLKPKSVRPPDLTAGEVDLPATGILANMARRLRSQARGWGRGTLRNFMPNEANVNDYRRGEGAKLHLHWDDRTAYDEPVCSLSLLGDATMTFARGGRSNFAKGSGGASQHQNSNVEQVRVHLPARSLLLLTGPSRFEWQHGIPEPSDFETERRVAVVFRRVRLAQYRGAVKKVPKTLAVPAQHTSVPSETSAVSNLAENGARTDNIVDIPVAAHTDAAAGIAERPRAPLASALILSTNWPDMDVSCAGRVSCGRINALQVLGGLRVIFASASKPGQSMAKLEAACGCKCVRIAANDEASVVSALQQSEPQLVIFDGFNAEERFGHYVRATAPDAMRVLDMQDFHALRLGRERLVADGASVRRASSYLPDANCEDLHRELAALHRCDCVLAISEEERRLLVEVYSLPAEKVHAAPYGYSGPPPDLSELPKFSDRQGIMFIGNWRHRPNRDCAQWLIGQVWPRVRTRLPGVELHVYGASPTSEDMALAEGCERAFVCGTCRSVAATMKKHRLLAAPLRYGAGVKGKLTDAFVHGLVCVTTPVGSEGLGGSEGFPGVVALGNPPELRQRTAQSAAEIAAEADAEAEEFANAVAEAYVDETSWASAQRAGACFVSQRFGAEAAAQNLWDALLARWQGLPASRARDFHGQMLWHSSLRSTEWMAKYLATKEELRRLKQAAGRPPSTEVPVALVDSAVAVSAPSASLFGWIASVFYSSDEQS